MLGERVRIRQEAFIVYFKILLRLSRVGVKEDSENLRRDSRLWDMI